MHHRVCLYISRYITVSPRAGPTAAVARCPGARCCCTGPSSVTAGDSHREHVTHTQETPAGAQVRVAGWSRSGALASTQQVSHDSRLVKCCRIVMDAEKRETDM